MRNTLSTAEIKAIPTPKPFQGAVTHFLASLYGQTIGNPWFIGGAIGIPLLMYFFFAVDQPYSDESVGNGNVQAAFMVGMACYGALTTAGWGACVTALGRNSGWWRTLALTPLSFPAYLGAQVVSAVCQAGLAALVTYVVGAFTGAHLTALAWGATYLLILVCCLPLAAMGFAIGQVVNEQAANFILTMILLVSSFLSGMFMPLEQMGKLVQDMAPYTPLYGIINLVRAPLIGWANTFNWSWVVNIGVYSTVFIGLAALLYFRKGRTER